MKKYLLIFFAFCLFHSAQSQVTTVCVADTLTLEVDNYHNGVVTWEESLDGESWATIPDISGTSYTFIPTETKYYRAVVITTECDPLFSEVTLVQLAPIAYAGTDRKIGGSKTRLLGNTEVNASGVWSIIEGLDGNIEDNTNPNSDFSGSYGEEYKLVWTLTNSCGASSDTIAIVFEEIVAKENFIVVDNTDEIFGDEAERAAGIYRIKFSDETIVPSDTMLLIGMREDISFLVEIQSYSFDNGTYVFTTTEGTLERIIQSGPINIGDAANEGILQDGKSSKSAFPTRETLKQHKGNKDQIVIYTSDFKDSYGNRQNVMPKTKGKGGVTLSIPDQDLFASGDEALKLSIADAYVRFDPNFVADVDIGLVTVKNIRIGLDNAEFEYNYKLTFEATAKKELSKELDIFTYTSDMVFIAGFVPIVVSVSVTLKAEAKIGASASLLVSQTKNYQKNFTAVVAGDKIKNLRFESSSSTKSTSEHDYSLNGKLEAGVSIGPEISLELYRVIGPYFSLPLTLNAEICMNTEKNWYAEVGLNISGDFGVKAHLGKLNLFDFQRNLFNVELGKRLKMPYKINVRSGNYQKGMQNTPLDRPIDLRVVSSYGFGVPLIPVRFSLTDGNGSITNAVKTTDKYGNVSVDDWTLGENADARLDISVQNCANEDIDDHSPISVYANGVYNCSNTDLAIQLNKTEAEIIPIATGGTSPYTYSTDGSSFGSSVPEFSYTNEGSFMVYVKDANSCNANRVVTVVKPDPCTSNPLFIETFIASNTIQLTAIGGKAPYQFSLNNTTDFAESNLFSSLTAGSHLAYAKDANGCIAASSSFTIEATGLNPISAVSPLNKAQYYNPVGVAFNWQSAVFANTQTYDLYLKNGQEAYATIAQTLTDESFTYTTDLNFGTDYTWKVAVKDESGTEKENAEFSFTTMADPAIVAVAPTLLQPTNNQLTDTTVTFKWVSQGGDFKYDVYLDGYMKFYSITSDSVIASNLTPGTPYNWKVVVKSPTSAQTQESEVWNFETKALLPSLVTNAAAGIFDTYATLGGVVTAEGLSAVSTRGICWGTSPEPTIDTNRVDVGSGPGEFSTKLLDLEPETQYFFRAFAINSGGTAYGNQDSLTTLAAMVMDADGNIYETVQIGTQVWLKENLKTTKYNDGTEIPNVIDNASWRNLPTPAYCWSDNNIQYKDVYGALYNWYVVNTLSNGGKNVCPVGFHVPPDADWTILTDYLGGVAVAGGKMKETGTDFWNSPNTGATNESGFTGLPGGNRDFSNGTFSNVSHYGGLWSSTEGNSSSAYYRGLSYNNASVNRDNSSKSFGISVRCLKDSLPSLVTNPATGIANTYATLSGVVTSKGLSAVSARGFCWGTSPEPTIDTNRVDIGSGLGEFSTKLQDLEPETQYFFRAFAINSEGTTYGNQNSLTTKGIGVMAADNNFYESIEIGTQVWLKENLKTTKYNNGDAIPTGLSNTDWESTTSGAYAIYSKTIFFLRYRGTLYNWYAVDDARGLCPIGWHVSTDADWTILTDYLGGEDVAGGKLKETGTEHWQSPNEGATNESGFTALPGSYRYYLDGTFNNVNHYGGWWSSTEGNSSSTYYRGLSYSSASVTRDNSSKWFGLSVRCVKDVDETPNNQATYDGVTYSFTQAFQEYHGGPRKNIRFASEGITWNIEADGNDGLGDYEGTGDYLTLRFNTEEWFEPTFGEGTFTFDSEAPDNSIIYFELRSDATDLTIHADEETTGSATIVKTGDTYEVSGTFIVNGKELVVYYKGTLEPVNLYLE